MLAYFVVRRWSKTFRGRHEDVDTRVCHSCLLTLLCEVGVRHLEEDMKMLTRVCHSCLLTLLCDIGVRHSEEDMKMLTQEYVIHACLLCCAKLE